MSNPPLKNIVFDLGGVIIDLDVQGTLSAFLELGFPKELLNYPENFYTDVFFNYETGKVSTAEFRDSLRRISGVNFSDRAFDEAWNSMLSRIPEKRTHILRTLAGHYRLYLLSNTCSLHVEYFTPLFRKVAGFGLSEVFSHCFYSHEIGMSKPDREVFQHVLDEAGILAEETLFLDDSIQNIKAARAMGFNVIHITQNLKMEHVGFNL